MQADQGIERRQTPTRRAIASAGRRPRAVIVAAIVASFVATACGSSNPSSAQSPVVSSAAASVVAPIPTATAALVPSPTPSSSPPAPAPLEPPILGRVGSTAFSDPAGSLEMHAVTSGSNGLIGVGSGPLGAAVWQSPDGNAWTRVPDAPALHGGKMESIAHGSGYVAVGAVAPETGRPIGAAWTSTDGLTWQRAPAAAGFDGATLLSVVGWNGGYVAVGLGSIRSGGTPEQRVWHSTDGLAWQPGTISADVAGQDLQLDAIASSGSRLVAVDAAGLAVLVSDDGATWHTVSDMSPFASADGLFDMTFTAVAATSSGGFVVVGADAKGPAAWASSDGLSWTRAPAQTAFAPGDNGSYTMSTLIALPSGLVGVGVSPNGDAVESWTSSDGLDWTSQASPKVPDAVIGTFGVEGLASVAGSLIAVGTYPPLANWTGRRAAAWVSPPPAATAVDVAPAAARCRDVPATLSGILSISPADRLRCFGRRTIHLVGFQADFGTEECAAFGPKLDLAHRIAAAVNGCGPQLATALAPDLLTLPIALAPSTGFKSPTKSGRTYTVTGQFDDPASARCRSASAVVVDCRTVFVATSYALRP